MNNYICYNLSTKYLLGTKSGDTIFFDNKEFHVCEAICIPSTDGLQKYAQLLLKIKNESITILICTSIDLESNFNEIKEEFVFYPVIDIRFFKDGEIINNMEYVEKNIQNKEKNSIMNSENTIFDLGDEEDRLVFLCPPLDRHRKIFIIGWLRISYGHLYSDCADFPYECLSLVDDLNKNIFYNDKQHARTFINISAKHNVPAESGTIYRDEHYNNLLKNDTERKFFRTTKELRNYINEKYILNND